ncbi:MAG: SPOR domain-containing protein [Candidatus Amulumruptor caecigallinarius]|nr:SPOR domain-containing protein [Candidatus Amulumruptor caecigallinarius]
MTRNLKLRALLLPALLTSAVCLYAQSPSENGQEEKKPENAVEAIEYESNGNVVIDIPDNILNNILKDDQQHVQHQPALRPGINKMSGFRIQVFSDGRNQASLESRARSRGNAIVAKFPKYRGQVYTHSSAPNWYTRIGNFKSQAEASSALSELKRAFPQFAAEMRVVRSQIVVIR